VAIKRKLLSDEDPELAASLASLGVVIALGETTNRNDSHAILSAALSLQRKLLGEDNPASIDSLRSLGWILESKDKLPEAEMVLREALTKWRKLAGKESSQSLETLESLVKVLLKEKKFAEAEQLLREALTPALLKQKSCLGLLERRTDLMARLGRWPEAKADSALALELEPDNQNRAHTLAPLLVMTHDRSAYEELCQRMLTTFADTADAFIADRVAKDSLLLPSRLVDLRVIDRLADTAIMVGNQASRFSDYHRLSMPYFQICKALSEYRQGHFAPAVEWVQKSLQNPQVNSQAQAYPMLAMAQWQLGQKDAARATLMEAEKSVARLFPGRNNDEGVWFPWIFGRIWLDEATALIESRAAPETYTGKE
jgi:tetratricopeptide (TPR) repeat protein